jgi:hypothetical protein
MRTVADDQQDAKSKDYFGYITCNSCGKADSDRCPEEHKDTNGYCLDSGPFKEYDDWKRLYRVNRYSAWEPAPKYDRLPEELFEI